MTEQELSYKEYDESDEDPYTLASLLTPSQRESVADFFAADDEDYPTNEFAYSFDYA